MATIGDVEMICLLQEARTPPADAGLPDRPDAVTARGSALTPVQWFVLDRIHRGMTGVEVAQALGIHVHSLIVHLRELRRHYGVTSTREAVAQALDHGDITA